MMARLGCFFEILKFMIKIIMIVWVVKPVASNVAKDADLLQ